MLLFNMKVGCHFMTLINIYRLKLWLNCINHCTEADIRKFIEIASQRFKQKERCKLEDYKSNWHDSQELSKQSQVDLRSIQMYEQRRNDINKAQADTLYKLAKTLGSTIEDLMEKTDCLLTDELSSI